MRKFLVLLFVLGVVGATVQSSPRIGGRDTNLRHMLHTQQSLSQHAGHAPGNIGVPLEAVVAVDGALNPDAVSDERAYDLFLASMAKASDHVADITLQRSGLSIPDRLAFRSGLGSLHAELNTLQARRGTLGNADVTQQQRVVLDNARSRVQGSLSAAGRAQLDNYIRTEMKKRVRIYRGSMPAQPKGGTK